MEINLPTSGCGIRSELQTDGSLEMSVRLVIQMDEKLRQRSDLERMVRCNLPNQMMEMNIGMTDEKRAIRYDFQFMFFFQIYLKFVFFFVFN